MDKSISDKFSKIFFGTIPFFDGWKQNSRKYFPAIYQDLKIQRITTI